MAVRFILEIGSWWFTHRGLVRGTCRFILKSLSRHEADFLLDILFHYFEHVLIYPHTLLPRYCGLYVVSDKGREVSSPIPRLTSEICGNIRS